ncbi:phosphotransferase [Halostella sp. JP-L12]|uniref:phosphotransferase family protein n=1 Tax=Halostella TaxID=1843185 RepID=UPI000EF78FD7|nr:MULTISPECIES: phosphotransferase [Halostella]NHN47419.1 phosphotransferase [Halostella sp. JP-L12]
MPDGGIAESTLAAMVRTVDPAATLRDATFVAEHASAAYRVTVDGGSGGTERFLKVTSDGTTQGLPSEARLLAAVGEHSDVPVPTVYGAVDGHDDLPAPFFVASAEPGTSVPRRRVGILDREAVRTVARESGRYLAAIHSFDAVDAYGFLEPAGETLCGDRPPSDFSVAVADPSENWPETVRSWVADALDAHADSEFGDLTPILREEVERELADLDGDSRPVLARIDHGTHNLLFDPDVGRIRSVVDWGFTMAATPAYDLAHVEPALAGGPWRFHPETRDQRNLVREALLAGYRERGDERAVERYREHGRLYRLLALTRSMFLLDDALRNPSAADRGCVASGMRERVESMA